MIEIKIPFGSALSFYPSVAVHPVKERKQHSLTPPLKKMSQNARNHSLTVISMLMYQ